MNTIKLNTIGEAPIKKGGASGGGGNYVYYRASIDEIGEFNAFSPVVKAYIDDTIFFLTFVDARAADLDILGWGFDTNLKITDPYNMTMITIGEVIAEASKNWAQITEEEFYNTNI